MRTRNAYQVALARALRHGTRALYADPAVYDALYRRRRADLAFYVGLALRHRGPVLELGVGSGRVCTALASHAISVVGVDAMASMLARARERVAALAPEARDRIELRHGDLRTVRLGRLFPLVIAPFNTFMHLYSVRDLRAGLATCRAHLRPGGRLAFDVLMPDLRALGQDPDRLYAAGFVRVPEHGVRYRLREGSHYDAQTQVRTTTFVLEPPAGMGGTATSAAIPLTQRQIFPAELELLLDSAGFELEHRYGDFVGGPLTSESQTQVVVARLRKRA